jgi:hypothetical protein
MSREDSKGAAWPLTVRTLAVAYVLSYPLQVAAVLGLGGAAALLIGLSYPLGTWLVELKVAAWSASPCAASIGGGSCGGGRSTILPEDPSRNRVA